MKMILPIVLGLLIHNSIHAQGPANPGTTPGALGQSSGRLGTVSPDDSVGAGLFSEEAEHDLGSAAANYRRAIQAFDRQRAGAANAIFRLGEVYRKLGRLEEAKVQYARILREFPDMVQLTELSHELLLGEEPKTPRGGEGPAAARENEPGPGIDASADHGGYERLLRERYGIWPGTSLVPMPGTQTDAGRQEELMRTRYGIVPERQSGFVVFESAGETAAQMLCINNLKQLGLAARIYSSEHEGDYPSQIELLTNSIQAPNVLVCLSDTNRHAAATWAEFDPARHVTYAYHGASVKESDAGQVLFHCPLHGHVTLGDGSVQQGQVDSHGGSGSQVRYAIRPGTADTGPVVGIEREAMITIARDGSLLFGDERIELDQLRARIARLLEGGRSELRCVIRADEGAETGRILEVLDGCYNAGVTHVTVASDTMPAISSELERLETELNKIKEELDGIGRNGERRAGEFRTLESVLHGAQARLATARQRYEAVLAVEPERLPGIINQDERYQRLKAEYEVAVLDDNEAELKRTVARLNQWVNKIYRPELQAEFELARQCVDELQHSQAEIENFRRELERQRGEKERRIESLMVKHKTLSALLHTPQERRSAERR